MRKTTGLEFTQSRASTFLSVALSFPNGQVWSRNTMSTNSLSGFSGSTGEWVPEMPTPSVARTWAISAMTPGLSVTSNLT